MAVWLPVCKAVLKDPSFGQLLSMWGACLGLCKPPPASVQGMGWASPSVDSALPAPPSAHAPSAALGFGVAEQPQPAGPSPHAEALVGGPPGQGRLVAGQSACSERCVLGCLTPAPASRHSSASPRRDDLC